jgi:2-polyprenyl-6-methoxyphenol hydroxylase-like FAD-dependent oxidoreductase
MEPRALIIGAGIGGLAAGIALRRRGWEVCIHERRLSKTLVALGLALSPSGNIEEALRRYERVRMQRTRRFVKLGPRIARVTTTRNPLIQSARTLAFRLLPASHLTKWANKRRDPHRALRTT